MGAALNAFFGMVARLFNTADLAVKSIENLVIAGEHMSASVADAEAFKRQQFQHEQQQKVLAFAKSVNVTIDASAT